MSGFSSEALIASLAIIGIVIVGRRFQFKLNQYSSFCWSCAGEWSEVNLLSLAAGKSLVKFDSHDRQGRAFENGKPKELDQEAWRVGISLFPGEGITLANHSRAHRLPGQLIRMHSFFRNSQTRTLKIGSLVSVGVLLATFLILSTPAQRREDRPRAREAGLKVGVLPVGPLNAITDVPGVLVGHTTIIRGENVRTGVTAVIPHRGNLFREKVPAAIFVGNGFGKLMGATQVDELGEIETPILLTSTLSVPRVADALLDFMLAVPGNEDVQSVNPVVGETNDGYLNDIRGRHITRDDVFNAIKGARNGPVEEGSVGAGTGTVAFGFKGGIGTASRKLPSSLGGYTVGVLVQTNFGGILTINGAPVGRELGRYYLKDQLTSAAPDGCGSQKGRAGVYFSACPQSADGSIIIVVATDAPVDARNLRRIGARTMMGLARTGAAGTNGSGDYAIAFSTAPELRMQTAGDAASRNLPRNLKVLPNDAMSPLFLAVIEATEEAIYNSLFRATTITGRGHRVEALPLDRTIEILRHHRAL